jgi:hypothetical protein
MSEEKKTLKEVIKQQLERDAAIRQPPTWEEISHDELKVRHIMEDVMGWECFGSWKGYLSKYGAQEWGLGAGKSYTTPTPVAYYAYGEWRVFSENHEKLDIFDPLHTMTDAWLVLQKVASFPDNMQEARQAREHFFRQLGADPTSHDVLGDCQAINVLIIASWTPEQICHAAYDTVMQTKRIAINPTEGTKSND